MGSAAGVRELRAYVAGETLVGLLDGKDALMPMIEYPRIKLDDLRADSPGLFDAARHVGVGIGWLPLVQAFVEEALPHDRAFPC